MKKFLGSMLVLLFVVTSSAFALTTTYNSSTTVGVQTDYDYAGAVVAVFWNGKNFVNNWDYGRQIQVTMRLNRLCEGFNPTEAGTHEDSSLRRPTSSRVLSHYNPWKAPNVVRTTNKPAYWRKPGEYITDFYGPTCLGSGPAENIVVQSEHLIYKTITVGMGPKTDADRQRIIKFQVTIEAGPEKDRFGNDIAMYDFFDAEAPTGYLNKEFTKFWKHMGNTTWSPITLENNALPSFEYNTIMVTNNDGSYAMGIWSPDQNAETRISGARYWVGWGEKETLKWGVNKHWTNVTPEEQMHAVTYIVVGTKTDVARIMYNHVIGKLY